MFKAFFYLLIWLVSISCHSIFTLEEFIKANNIELRFSGKNRLPLTNLFDQDNILQVEKIGNCEIVTFKTSAEETLVNTQNKFGYVSMDCFYFVQLAKAYLRNQKNMKLINGATIPVALHGGDKSVCYLKPENQDANNFLNNNNFDNKGQWLLVNFDRFKGIGSQGEILSLSEAEWINRMKASIKDEAESCSANISNLFTELDKNNAFNKWTAIY